MSAEEQKQTFAAQIGERIIVHKTHGNKVFKIKKKTDTKPKEGKRPRTRDGLTYKQKAFVNSYIKNSGNGTLAALETYNTTDAMTASVIAAENIVKPNIASLIEQRITAKTLDADFIINNLIQDCNSENPIIRTKSLELLGKYKKLFTDKVDHNQVLETVKTIGWED